MAQISQKIYFGWEIVDSINAQLHVWSSAVLYGLSVYTVFPIVLWNSWFSIFRINEHIKRLQNSAKLIGINIPDECLSQNSFLEIVRNLVLENQITHTVFARASIHVDELVPGTKSKGLHTVLSIFLYEANPIVPQDGVRLKISPWRRNPDFCIPSRAKVNWAYVNSVLAKQDAIDSGYDDAIFLDMNGHVCELSAANIFIVRDGILVTPSVHDDILEWINRKTIIEVAKTQWIMVEERSIDMTELYIADEIFVTWTSAFVSWVIGVDGRNISSWKIGEYTKNLSQKMQKIQRWEDDMSIKYMTLI